MGIGTLKDKDVTVNSLAEYCGLHPSYLSRLFYSETGTHLKAFVLDAKIDTAQNLVASAAVGAGGASGLTAEQERDIDVDRDGDFDAADAAIILTYAAYSGTGGTMTLREYLNQ